MQNVHEPQVGAFFKISRWNENSIEQLKTELLKALAQDPYISDASRIGLEVQTAGNEVRGMRVIGTVPTEDERTRAARIIEVNTHDEVAVKNELAVQ